MACRALNFDNKTTNLLDLDKLAQIGTQVNKNNEAEKIQDIDILSLIGNVSEKNEGVGNFVIKKRKIEHHENDETIKDGCITKVKSFSSNLVKVTSVPKTPIKRSAIRVHSPFGQLYLKASQEQSMTYQGREVKLTVLSNEGTFMDVFTTTADHQIVPSVQNDQIVVKFFNKQRVCSHEKRLFTFMRNSLQNYEKALQLGLNVATIYNKESALKDYCFIQEKIPSAIDLTQAEQIAQVRKFFIASLQHQQVLDLSPTNLRVREDGSVALIDFIEEPEDENYLLLIDHAVEAWCTYYRSCFFDQLKVEKFAEQFTKGFENYGYINRNREIVEKLFGSTFFL